MGNETKLICNSTILTPEQKVFFENYDWWMETISHLVLGVFGIVINSVTIFVLTKKNTWKIFFNRLLVSLAIVDSLYLLCELSEAFRHKYNTMVQQHIFVNFVYPIRNMLMCGSIYITIVLASERYEALKNPAVYRIRAMTNMSKRHLRYFMFILIFNIIFYLPKFNDLKVIEYTECSSKNISRAKAREITKVYMELYYKLQNNITTENDTLYDSAQRLHNEHCPTTYGISATEQRVHYQYVLWYINVLNLSVTVVIPLLLLIYLNGSIVVLYKQFIERQPSRYSNNTENAAMNTNRAETSNEKNKTKILFLVVFMFILCHSVRVIMNVNEFITMTKRNIRDYEDFEEARSKGCHPATALTRYFKPINQLLVIINSIVNPFIYVIFDSSLRIVLRQTVFPVVRFDTNNTQQTSNGRLIDANNIEMSNMNGANV